MVAAVQSVVIGYGLEKFYQTWSRSWVILKNIFNLLKSKLKRKDEEKKNPKESQLKERKSSLKRLGQYYKLCIMLIPVIEINVQQDFKLVKILLYIYFSCW